MRIQTIVMRTRTHSMQATSNLLRGPHIPITTPQNPCQAVSAEHWDRDVAACQTRTCSSDEEQRVASSRRVQCCAMQCMCERPNKGSGKQSTGKADTPCKQRERGRRLTGKGLPCKAGMRTKGKNLLPRENLVTHLDRTTSYGGARVRVGRPSDTLGTAVPSCHRQPPLLPDH
jgi:hypothetical protein